MTRYELWRRSGLLLVAAACAALSSCISAQQPLGDAMKSEPDKGLIGTWVREDNEGTHVMVIGRHELLTDETGKPVPRGLMSYEQSLLGKDDRLSHQGGAAFFVSRIQGESPPAWAGTGQALGTSGRRREARGSASGPRRARRGDWGQGPAPPREDCYEFRGSSSGVAGGGGPVPRRAGPKSGRAGQHPARVGERPGLSRHGRRPPPGRGAGRVGRAARRGGGRPNRGRRRTTSVKARLSKGSVRLAYLGRSGRSAQRRAPNRPRRVGPEWVTQIDLRPSVETTGAGKARFSVRSALGRAAARSRLRPGAPEGDPLRRHPA